MSREKTDTRGGNFISPGHYHFTIDHVVKGKTPRNFVYYEFFMVTDRGENYKQRFMRWLITPMLKALGCEETTPGVFDWDTEEVNGLSVEADVVLEDRNGSKYPTMINIESAMGTPEVGAEDPEFDTVLQEKEEMPPA